MDWNLAVRLNLSFPIKTIKYERFVIVACKEHSTNGSDVWRCIYGAINPAVIDCNNDLSGVLVVR